MRTYLAKPNEVNRKWVLIDAKDKIVGRLAVKIATILRGRHKPIYTPHIDTGDFVIVINASKVKFTGNKESDKIYQSFSGYMGGQKNFTARQIRDKNPERLIHDAVRRMMPRNKLCRSQLSKLHIYPGDSHPHQAQQPETAL